MLLYNSTAKWLIYFMMICNLKQVCSSGLVVDGVKEKYVLFFQVHWEINEEN